MSPGGSPGGPRRLTDAAEVRRAFAWPDALVYHWTLDPAGAARVRRLALGRLAAALLLAPVAATAVPALAGLAHPVAGVHPLSAPLR